MVIHALANHKKDKIKSETSFWCGFIWSYFCQTDISSTIWLFFQMICKPKHSKNKYSLKNIYFYASKRFLIRDLSSEEQSAGISLFPSYHATFPSSNLSISLLSRCFVTVALQVCLQCYFSNSNVHPDHLGTLWKCMFWTSR